MAEARRTFAPVVLLGLAASGLAAVAGHRAWAVPDAAEGAAGSLSQVAVNVGGDVGESPAAGALALVALAGWGVLLVTRGRWRRGVAVLCALAAAGLLAVWVGGWSAQPEAVRDAVVEMGVVEPEVGRSVWFWLAGVAGLLALVAGGAAVRWSPAWPEMGSRYDAPGGRGEPGAPTSGQRAGGETEPASSLELWQAIDEGRDPTQGPG